MLYEVITRSASVLWRGSEGDRRGRSARNRPLAEQPGRKFPLALPTTRTRNPAVSADAKSAEIRYRPRLGLQPFRGGAKLLLLV